MKMKKKLLLTSLFLITLLFASCSSETDMPQMTFVNESSEIITNIEIKASIAPNTKAAISESFESLSDGETVGPDESLTYILPLQPTDSYMKFEVTYGNSGGFIYINYEDDADFTLTFNDTYDFSITGSGAEEYRLSDE